MLLQMPLKWFARLILIMPLAIRHITEYYDMKISHIWIRLRWQHGSSFPRFVKDHASEPKTLYEIEMVKVPIPDKKQKS